MTMRTRGRKDFHPMLLRHVSIAKESTHVRNVSPRKTAIPPNQSHSEFHFFTYTVQLEWNTFGFPLDVMHNKGKIYENPAVGRF